MKLSPPEGSEVRTGLSKASAGVITLAKEVHLQGEVVARIVQLLTPSGTGAQVVPSVHTAT